MSADTILQKRNRIWIACQRQKSCHIDPTPIKASKSFAIDFSSSKVFKCSTRHPLEAEKKRHESFWMPRPNIKLEDLSSQRLWEFSFHNPFELQAAVLVSWGQRARSPRVCSELAPRQIFFSWDSSVIDIHLGGDPLECLSDCHQCVLLISFISFDLFCPFLTVCC